MFQKVVLKKTVDKVGFKVAVDEAHRKKYAVPVHLGELRNLRIQGDRADGSHTTRIYDIQNVSGKDERFFQDIDGPISFRKTKDGSWLIDRK